MDPPETLYSTSHRLKGKSFQPNATHPFASGSTQLVSDIQLVVDATAQISHSLDTFISHTSFTNPKLVSQLRQHSNTSQALRLLEHQTQQTIDGLSGSRLSLTRYGEDIPGDPLKIPQWCVSRIESWATTVGLQSFREEDQQNKITLAVAGQVLVLDIVLTFGDKMEVISVKTSYASQSQSGPSYASGFLDAFLQRIIESFLQEVQSSGDPLQAAQLGTIVADQFSYLAMLDLLASKPETEGGGSRWFNDVSLISAMVDELANFEANVVASTLSMQRAPLDIFLLRSHALPLPYLSSPSISFLAYLSPKCYLSLKRATAIPEGPWDISLSTLRAYLTIQPRPSGAYIATLRLSTQDTPTINQSEVLASATHPSFGNNFPIENLTSHHFPQIDGHVWLLDFRENGGPQKGIIMSQSRMREIEAVCKGGISSGITATMLGYGEGSWVDMLLNSGNSSERYTCLHRSSNSSYPPLHLRLTTPEENGFKLERVVVRSMREVLGVLKIVKEQCWINEILLECQWTPENTELIAADPGNPVEITEHELQVVLSGAMKPEQIPINVFIPPSFDVNSTDLSGAPRITMVMPMVSQTSAYTNMMNLDVVYDPTSIKGVRTDLGIIGAMADGEEICRRGGCFSLPGRVWIGMNG